MEFLARCSRCGALVDASSNEFGEWKIVYYTPCAAVVSGNDTPVRNVSDYTALCPDCMGQLKAWLDGGQAKDPSIAEGIIRYGGAEVTTFALPHLLRVVQHDSWEKHEDGEL